MKNMKYKAKGFSLIELLLVLGVLAILLVAAFVVYPQVRDRNQANTEASNLTSIKAGVNNLYASKGGNYTGLTSGVANQARVFPASMNQGTYTSAAPITSSWGGNVSVAANGATTIANTPNGVIAANRSFTITYESVPAGVCLPLVSAASNNFQGVLVGGTSVLTSTGFNPATAATQCTGNANVVFISN
jgi:hypothetical protein